MVIEWERTALPVLAALAASTDRNVRDGILHLGGDNRGSRAFGLDTTDDELHDALLALADVGYVSVDDIEYAGRSAAFVGTRITGRGMQALGQWPSLQTVMTPITLLAVLDRLDEYAADEPTRIQLEKAKAGIRHSAGAGLRDAVAAFGAEALKAKLGLR